MRRGHVCWTGLGPGKFCQQTTFDSSTCRKKMPSICGEVVSDGSQNSSKVAFIHEGLPFVMRAEPR